jgi:arylsulfatase
MGYDKLMKRNLIPCRCADRFTCLLVAIFGIGLGSSSERAAAADTGDVRQPNILLIMADDLGYSDLGCYGGEIQTPNLDALAAGGLRFTQFYNTGRCWPTRASLLTGYYPQSVRRDAVPGIASGGQGTRPTWAPLICRPLSQAGYRTYHTGKWHIDGQPIEAGFDLSYNLEDQNRFFNPTAHSKNDRPLPAVAKDSGYYATVALGEHAIECLTHHASAHAEQPFFQYLAFTAPHFPLQALPADIDHYRQLYRVGWDTLRANRWSRLQGLGLVSGELSAVQNEVGPPYDRPADIALLGGGEVNRPRSWESLDDLQAEFQATKMAIHAAMVDCLDRQVGRVLDLLRETGQLDNTIVLFLSDNGASAEIMVRGDGHDPAAAMGSWASHLCLGPGWSTVSNTPFRYHKTWTHEGGIATPLIVHWPAGIAARSELRSAPGHVIDIWPTLLEVAGASEFVTDAPAKPGQSLIPTFHASADDPSSENLAPPDSASEVARTLWWSHEGNRALREGRWKISAVKDGDWELYDLANDRTETHDLAGENPGKLAELQARWDELNEQHTRMATATSK